MKILMILAATSALVALVAASHSIRLRGIYITQPVEGHQSSLGVVKGVRNCGGPGKVLEWRVDGCGEGVCRLPGDGLTRPTELEFVPSEDIDALGIRAIIIENGATNNIYERPIADSEVQGGETYIMNAAVTISEKLKGKTLTAQYILFRVDDNNVETCVEADFEIY